MRRCQKCAEIFVHTRVALLEARDSKIVGSDVLHLLCALPRYSTVCMYATCDTISFHAVIALFRPLVLINLLFVCVT